MIGIVRITTTLIFNEGEPKTTSCSSGSRNVASDKTTIAFEFVGKIASACAMAKASDI
jgi:hypothetical protein